jgi:hypothetical protein
MDIKSAFLNGDFDEEVYVSQPPGFIADRCEQGMCKLHKALYIFDKPRGHGTPSWMQA